MKIVTQEYWSGLPFPSPGNLPDPGIEPLSPALYVWRTLYCMVLLKGITYLPLEKLTMLDFLFFQPPLCNMILGMWLRPTNQRGLCQALMGSWHGLDEQGPPSECPLSVGESKADLDSWHRGAIAHTAVSIWGDVADCVALSLVLKHWMVL